MSSKIRTIKSLHLMGKALKLSKVIAKANKIRRARKVKLSLSDRLDRPLQATRESNVVEDISKDQGTLWKTLTDTQKRLLLDEELDRYIDSRTF